ncbi:MAG: tetratricopeptide repeat protein [Gemmatimonadota bacterium]
MQAHRNRPTRQELEEDHFVEWVMEAVDYVRNRAQLFVGGAAAIVVAILAVTYVQSSRQDARHAATALLGQAIIADESGRVEEAVGLAEQVNSKYAGTPAAAQATVLLANRYYLQGRYADAERLFQSYLDDYGDAEVLAYAAWSGLAACYEAQGDMRRAADKYRSYADQYSDRDEAALALMDAARCYGAAGDAAQQKQALERVTRDYPKTPVVSRAREDLGML